MNVAATHDSPRLSTSLYNKTMDKYNASSNHHENPDYKINSRMGLPEKNRSCC